MIVDLSKYKALVIDDFAQMRQNIKRMLESCCIRYIDDCGTGEDAIERIRKINYDLILCDYNLGEGKDGQQLLEEIKHEGILDPSAIFMMITAENTVAMVMAAVEYEPDAYLTKPFTKDVLLKRLERILERKGSLRDIGRAVLRKDYAVAVALCDKQLHESPKNALEILKVKAEIFLTINEPDKAINVYNSILNIHSLPWAKGGLGRALFMKGKLHDARQVFEEVIDEAPHFVIALDWLAKIHLSLNDSIQAQTVLEQASSKSPKVILRRQALGDVAYTNKDYDAAEHAYKSAIKLGRGSKFKRAAEYTQLAKIYGTQKFDQKAMTVLRLARDEFIGNNEVNMQLYSVEGIVHHKVGRESAASEALGKAMHIYRSEGNKLTYDASMDLAHANLLYGDKALGKELIKRIISNNHDDQALLQKARQTMLDAGMDAPEAELLIRNSVNAIININNEGAKLANAGNLNAAIELFEDALKQMPHNKVVNLNAAQALIIYMKKNGSTPEQLENCRTYLNAARNITPNDPKLLSLLDAYKQISKAQDIAQ